MKIHKITLKNFRGYQTPTPIIFNDLTVFIGRNDIGKSTILEALDLFFNDGKGAIKYDDGDINVTSEIKEFSIDVTFTDLPKNVIVDTSFQTTLADEYLLNAEGELEILKKFNGKKCTSIFVRAYHPTRAQCSDLHMKKKIELNRIIQDNHIRCDNLNVNSIMRRAIWKFYSDDLQLSCIDLDVTKGDDTKKLWEKLSYSLPVYSLFQSDRQNSDKDSEIQDPLKIAVAQFLKDEEIQNTLNEIAKRVEQRLKEVSDRTLKKIREMDPNVADRLTPVLPESASIKWSKLFDGVSLASDDNIPINKRGSGIKRLILLNFFRAEAERRQNEGNSAGIIYAIEEPETSQHFSNQRILIDALITLSKATNTQVILTTHSGVIVKQLKYDDLRLIVIDAHGDRTVTYIKKSLLRYPSLNEVNYIAFGEVTEEYHDELYGYITGHGWLSDYEKGKTQREYIRIKRDGKKTLESRTLTHYIRDVQHHPENPYNIKYTDQELAQSISDMRNYLKNKNSSTEILFEDEQ